MQSGQRQNGKFSAGIAAIQVFAGVGFRIAAGLRFFKSLAEGNARSFNAAENVVAGAVQDACNAVQSVSAKPRSQGGQNGNAAGNGGSIFQLASLCACQLQQLRPVTGDQLLVGGDY